LAFGKPCAAAAFSAFAGSAIAGQQTVRTGCTTSTNDYWASRCCGTGQSNCLGGESHDHEHNSSRAAN